MDNLFSGESETYNTTYDSHDSSFQTASLPSTLSPSRRRRPYRVAVDHSADISRRSSSASRRPPLPPGTVDRRSSRAPSGGHVQVMDARSLYYLQVRAQRRALQCRSWHNLTTPTTSEPSPKMTHDALQSPTDTAPPTMSKTQISTSPGGGKFRFLSQLFAKKSPQTFANSSPSVDRHPSLRPALRGAAGSNLPRSASAGRINDVASSSPRPKRTVRWDISPDMDKVVVIPTWKRPKKVIVQESSV